MPFGRRSPLETLALPGAMLAYKYSQFRQRRREAASRRVTERELSALHHKIVSSTCFSFLCFIYSNSKNIHISAAFVMMNWNMFVEPERKREPEQKYSVDVCNYIQLCGGQNNVSLCVANHNANVNREYDTSLCCSVIWFYLSSFLSLSSPPLPSLVLAFGARWIFQARKFSI